MLLYDIYLTDDFLSIRQHHIFISWRYVNTEHILIHFSKCVFFYKTCHSEIKIFRSRITKMNEISLFLQIIRDFLNLCTISISVVSKVPQIKTVATNKSAVGKKLFRFIENFVLLNNLLKLWFFCWIGTCQESVCLLWFWKYFVTL